MSPEVATFAGGGVGCGASAAAAGELSAALSGACAAGAGRRTRYRSKPPSTMARAHGSLPPRRDSVFTAGSRSVFTLSLRLAPGASAGLAGGSSTRSFTFHHLIERFLSVLPERQAISWSPHCGSPHFGEGTD